MNFLSHYYLLPDKENADKVIGNLVPDLMRGFTKIYRRDIRDNPSFAKSSFLRGIHFHLKVDQVFHEHEFFLDSCELIKSKMEQENMPQRRSFIVAHIMVELLIDQYLIRQNISLADNFYACLSLQENDILLEKINITLNRQNSSKIISIFKSFKEHKHAYSLQQNEGILEALHHIIGRRIGEDFKSPKWHEIIKEARQELEPKLPQFLQKIKEALENA